ncbi:hypothetical protein HK101_000822, partial [Irineochytrium annulatum]
GLQETGSGEGEGKVVARSSAEPAALDDEVVEEEVSFSRKASEKRVVGCDWAGHAGGELGVGGEDSAGDESNEGFWEVEMSDATEAIAEEVGRMRRREVLEASRSGLVNSGRRGRVVLTVGL